jgi:asparagine synthase (glutamine-hydrolysing)
MTAIFAAVGGAPLSAASLQRAVREMASRGAERMDARVGEGAGLAAGRFEWEADPVAHGPLIVDDGVRVVVVDGSLYYRDDLRRAICAASGSRPLDVAGDSTAHLVLGAYRAWGTDCARHLEGDFAFAVWDRESRTLTCARDLFGTRSLFYGRDGERVVVASMASAVARRTPHRGALDVAAVGESLAGLFNVGHDTAYLGVAVVPAGHTLTVGRGGAVAVRPHWEPPAAARPTSFEEGADELRALLAAAVDERMPAGTSALWLSGGWDSSSILASAMTTLRGQPAGRQLLPVSMSYPVGDRGREDEAIQAVADHLGVGVSWVRSGDVPLLSADPAADAARRDLPFAHAFELWSRAMIARSHELGARVVLTGTGGDELFAGTNVFMSDLLRFGSWGELALEWYRMRGRTLHGFHTRVVRPMIAAGMHDAASGAPGPFEQHLLPWLREDFVTRASLRERERAAAPYGRCETLSRTEQVWAITAPMFARIRSTLFSAQLEAGVLVRSPFFDLRLARFALSRPRHERVTARETKRLLRRAMQGLLPDAFLAPRPERTGVTTHYLRDELRGPARPLFDAAFEAPVLAELGIVDAAKLRDDWHAYLRNGEGLGLRFYDVYQTELWVRAHLDRGERELARREPLGAVAS